MIAVYCAWCKPRRLIKEIDDGNLARQETDGICAACAEEFVEQLRDGYVSSNTIPTPQEMLLEFRSRSRTHFLCGPHITKAELVREVQRDLM